MTQSNAVYFDLLLTNGTQTSIQIPWIVSSKANYTGIESFMKDLNAPPTSFNANTPVEVVKSAFTQPPPLIEKNGVIVEPPSHILRVNSPSDSSSFKLLVNSENLQFWMLNDSRTLVMYLDTMAPSHYVETYKASPISTSFDPFCSFLFSFRLIVCFVDLTFFASFLLLLVIDG